MTLPALPDHPTWTMLLLSLAAPVLTVVAAYIKLKQSGITAINIEEIKDRAAFRQHMMERLEVVEGREQSLIKQLHDMMVRHENRERELLTEIAELHLKIENLEERLEAKAQDIEGRMQTQEKR